MTETRRRFARLIVGMALVAAAASIARAEAPTGFGDWVVGCDNVRTCIAIGLSDDGADVTAYLKVARSGEPGAEANITVVVTVDPAGTPASAPLRLAFDDPTIPGLPPAPLAAKRDDNYPWGSTAYRATLSGMPARDIVNALRKATTLTLTPSIGKAEAPPGVVSLSGAVAALRFMDDRQKRAGTVTALVARGDQPLSSVPAPPPLPVVAALPIARLQQLPPIPKALPRPADDAEACHNDDGNKGPVAPPRIVARLSASLTLWGVCREEGGYGQITYDFYLADSGKLGKARFDPPPGEKLDGVVAPYFPSGDVVASVFRARAIGDCGERESWTWDGTGFRLLVAAEMGQCRGVDPNDWPVSYRTEKR